MNAHEKERNEMLSNIDEEKIKALQEQPVKIDIRKELASIEFMGVNDARDSETIARHFYELERQSKQEVCEGLDGEITEFIANNYEVDYYDGLKHHGEYLDTYDVEEIARNFAQWQREQMISALKNGGDLPIEFIDKFHEIDRTAFQDGQANMREQLMKEAVECMVYSKIVGHGHMEPGIEIDFFHGEFNVGDKVSVIILKKDNMDKVTNRACGFYKED